MEGRASPMVPSGAFSGPEHRFEASNSNSSGISSLGGTHSDGVEATVRVQNERKVRTHWSEEKTEQLLRAYRKRKDENHRFIMREVDWQIISECVGGMTWIDSQRRMDTLTKSFRDITKHCAAQHKQFSQLTEKDLKSLKLATKMKADWYDQMCKIKEKPLNGVRISRPVAGNRMISSSPAAAAVLAGPHGGIIGQVVGTPVAASSAQDRRHSACLLGSCELSPRAHPPCHPHHHSNHVDPWTATVADAAEPPHIPPADLDYLQAFTDLEDIVCLSPLRT